MVRAGVVNHPSKWSFSCYNEIQEPRRKNVLIDYERLQGLLGAGNYDQLRRSHKGWVEEHLGDGTKGITCVRAPLPIKPFSKLKKGYRP
jgi:putative transposase